jgi:hypothetical protein
MTTNCKKVKLLQPQMTACKYEREAVSLNDCTPPLRTAKLSLSDARRSAGVFGKNTNIIAKKKSAHECNHDYKVITIDM